MSGGDFYVRRGTLAPPYEHSIDKQCVGADDSVRPISVIARRA